MRKISTWKSVVIWSIISAAFIGPGTVTTAISAGSIFKLDLLWAVLVATGACIILQEVAARISIGSGLNIGQALTIKFGTRNGIFLQWLIGGTVICGCAAYEAGNILGAVSGLNLLSGFDTVWLTVAISVAAFVLLWKGNPKWIFNVMMILIVVMGFAFIRLALMQDFSVGQVLQSSTIPVIPAGGELLLLGLVGTTIVPYNLFLASGISKGQGVPMMRAGLIISILLGGLITGAILIAGTAINDFSSFTVLFNEFETKVGRGAALALALGLAAAGFSSTITAPYASSVVARSVFGVEEENKLRVLRIVVLMTGFVIGIMGLRPIQVILVVQALNGFILPLLVIFLILIVNDPVLIPARFRHGRYYNLVLMIVLTTILLISLSNVDKAFISGFNLNSSGHSLVVYSITSMIVAVVAGLVLKMELQKKI